MEIDTPSDHYNPADIQPSPTTAEYVKYLAIAAFAGNHWAEKNKARKTLTIIFDDASFRAPIDHQTNARSSMKWWSRSAGTGA